MSLQFIIGRAGSGKTHWIFQRILTTLKQSPLGPPIYFLLPTQATFQTQRHLACESNLQGYFRPRILSFDDLSAEILDDCGGTAIPEVTTLGRRMILGHLLRRLQPNLKFFHHVARQPGVAVELDSTFSELERCGQDVPALLQELSSPNSTPALATKLHDLNLIYTAYTQFLGQDRLDPQRRLNEALASIQRCALLRDADIYVDGFYDFDNYQRLLAALGKTCRSVSITMLLDPASPLIANPHHIPDEMTLFHRPEHAYRRLWFALEEQNVPRLPPVILEKTERFQSPALAALETWNPQNAPATPDGIEFIEAPDRRSEVDAVARRIADLTAAGLRYRQIAVLMRSSEDYDEIIKASFGEHHIPFFIDRRRTAAHHPLLQFIRAALQVARNNYPHEPMMTLIKSGLVGLTLHEADELENYVLRHGIKHATWISPSPWTGHAKTLAEDADDLAPIVDPLALEKLRRRLTDNLSPFVKAASSATTVRQFAQAIFTLLESFQVRATIVAWMAQSAARDRLDQQAEHERVWAEVVSLFDELVDLLGSEPVNLPDFQSILDTGLESFDLALTPPTVDQVLVGPVDRTRTPAIKACFVLGLNEGQFPKLARESSVFSDADRRSLRQRDIDLEPDTQRRLLDEQLLGYIAFTRASEKLYLTRSAADDNGKAQSASPLWRHAREQFPSLPIHQAPRQEQLPPDLISTPRQLITSLMRYVRSGAVHPDWSPIYQWLATETIANTAVDVMRYRAWKALSYENKAQLSPDYARALYTSPLKVHASQLESFGNCPFQYFARYGLALKERQQRQVTGADLSRVYHDVLEALLRELLADGRDFTKLDQSQINEILARLTATVGQRLRGELMLDTARSRYLLNRIGATLQSVVAAQTAAAARGHFQAAFANVRFGDSPGDLPPLDITTPAGNHVLIREKIDRVDILPETNDAAVIDYKLSINQLGATMLFHGLSLQLLTYLLALDQNAKALAGRKLAPAAAFYVQLLRRVRLEDPQAALSPEDPKFHLLVKPRGIFHAAALPQLDATLTQGASEVVAAFIKQDGTFGKLSTTDVAEPAQLAALLNLIRQRIGQTADRILAGEISIKPYRLGRDTPCPQCEFRDLCRFDPAQAPYQYLQPISRDQLLQQAVESEAE